jgi:DNA/RNA endonuclease YhcR with UshA esterase domain
MFKWTFGFLVLCGLLIASGSLQAHHSLSAVYDIRAQEEVTGVVTKVEFMNPHGAMTLVSENNDGTETEWVLTTGSANTLSSLGFGRGGPNTVTAGDVVTITYFPARNGNPLGFIRSITLPNQTEIEFDPDE